MRRTQVCNRLPHRAPIRTTIAGIVAGVMAGLLLPQDVRAQNLRAQGPVRVTTAAPLAAASEIWVCSDWKGSLSSGRPPLELALKDGLLIEQPLGSPRYSLLANSEHAMIGVDHSAEFEPVMGMVNIFVSTVAIDKSTGNFTIAMSVGDKSWEHRAGNCRKFEQHQGDKTLAQHAPLPSPDWTR